MLTVIRFEHQIFPQDTLIGWLIRNLDFVDCPGEKVFCVFTPLPGGLTGEANVQARVLRLRASLLDRTIEAGTLQGHIVLYEEFTCLECDLMARSAKLQRREDLSPRNSAGMRNGLGNGWSTLCVTRLW